MKNNLLLIMALVLLSCGGKDRVPKGILPPDKMEDVLWDVLRADEMVNYQYEVDSSVNRFVRSVELYKQVFRIHKTNEEQFRKSFKFYQTHPELFRPVFDSLQRRGPGSFPLSSPV